VRRLLIAALSPWVVLAPVFAGDLGPADLAPEQLSSAFPPVGTKWNAWCGTYRNPINCSIELGSTELLIDEKFKISYTNIVKSESHDAMMTITRLARQDPAWSGWDCYSGSGKGCSADTFANTVAVQYRTSAGALQVALFAFRENKISDWYGFGNAMRLILYGARPAAGIQEPSK
jgi:hypothetical protein